MVYFIQLAGDISKTIHAYENERETLCGISLHEKQFEHLYDPLYGEICDGCLDTGSVVQLDCDQYLLQVTTFKKAKEKLLWMHVVYSMLGEETQFKFELTEAIERENGGFIGFLKSEKLILNAISEEKKKLQIRYREEGNSHSVEMDFHDIEITYASLKEFMFDELRGVRN